jgi:hypothetical protein
MFRNTRNIVIQDGGTFTDAGFRLDVSGNTRINGGLTATTISATTYQNLPSDVIIINSTPIQSGFTGGILFQSSASTVSQSSNLFWDNANGRLGIGTSTPNHPLEVVGNIRSTTISAITSISTGSVNANVLASNGANITFIGSGTAAMVLFQSTRNIVIQNGGTFTDAGFRLDVIGTARISGATQILSSLSVTGNLFGTFYSSTGGFSPLIANYDTGVTSVTNNYTGFGITRPFNPTGGVTTYDGFRFNATINQTGGSSGTTRGLYITPIISAATDFRAIETTVGNVMLNTVGGNTLIGTSTNSIYKLDVSGSTRVRGNTIISATTSTASGSTLTVVGSGSTQPIFTVQGSSGELFSVTDSLIGSLFSVNDISGLPILEVFSNNTVLMGTYLAPSLNTTSRVTANSGTTTVYTIPQSAYTGAFFEYTVSDGTNLRAGNIMSIWSGVTVNFTETQTTDIGSTSAIAFTMSANTTNVVLQTSATTNNWTVKTIIRSI